MDKIEKDTVLRLLGEAGSRIHQAIYWLDDSNEAIYWLDDSKQATFWLDDNKQKRLAKRLDTIEYKLLDIAKDIANDIRQIE